MSRCVSDRYVKGWERVSSEEEEEDRRKREEANPLKKNSRSE